MMKNEGSITTVHRVKLDAVYTSDLDYFDFDSDMEPWTVARAMAREPWNKEYFQRLKDAHQSHYEQFGDVSGILTIDGSRRDILVNLLNKSLKNDLLIQVNVMRDHTHGCTRDWKLMHRYCLHNFTCKNGIRGFLGIVSQPGTFSFLELGYIYNKHGEKQSVQVYFKFQISEKEKHHTGGGFSNMEFWRKWFRFRGLWVQVQSWEQMVQCRCGCSEEGRGHVWS